MSVSDRWHTKQPRKVADPDTGDLVPVQPCREHSRGTVVLYPSTDHLKGDRWQVRWRDENDKQKSANRPKRGGTKNDVDPEIYAVALDAKIAAELNAGTYIDPAAGKVTLAQYAKGWRAGLTGDPATLANMDLRLAHIVGAPPKVEGRTVRRLGDGTSAIAGTALSVLSRRPSLIQQWIKGMERNKLSPVYIGEIVGTLSSIFLAALDDGVVARNPTRAKSVTLPPPDQRMIVPWTRPMVDAAREHLGDDGAMVDLGAAAGLRQGEIFGIAKDDIVFLGRERKIRVRRQVAMVDGVLVFKAPKRRKTRDVPLSDALGRRLAAHMEATPPTEITLPWVKPDGKPHTVELLFVRANGRPHHRQSFGYRWQRTRRAAGAPADRENGMHVLRHTYASVMLAGGVDVIKLAAWLGHSDPGFTLRVYGHFVPDVTDTGRTAMDAWLEGDSGESAQDVPSEGDG